MTLTEQQVREIFDQQFAIMKPFLKEGVLGPDKGKLPEPWVGYAAAWHQRRELGVHIINGDFPDHLFEKRAPNQTEEELEWLRGNFKQTTLCIYLDLENTVARASHPRNWSIEFDEDTASKDVQEYVTTGIKEWGSVHSFMQNAGLRIKLQDAMGIIAVLPSDVSVLQYEDGTQEQDMDAVMDPDIFYFKCEQLWGFEYDKWYLLRLNTNSWVDSYKKQQTGVLCWMVDGENVWRIEQVGRPSDWKFDIRLEFRHGIGEAPCINLMGTPSVKEGRLIWESPYLAPKDLLDIALMNANYLEASMQTVTYPHTVMIGDPCDFVDTIHGAPCVGGWIDYTKDDIQYHVPCAACKNTGQKGRLSRLGKLVINRNPDSTSSDQVTAQNALAFVSPATDTLEFTSSHITRYESKARAIIHLPPTEASTGKTTEEAEAHDKARDAFVKTICDQQFLIHRCIISWMGKMRHGPDWDGFVLRPPTNYDLRTDADHLNEISQAKKNGLAPWRIELVENEYDAGKYGGDPVTLKMLAVISRADRIKNMTMQTVQAEAATGRVMPWEIRLNSDAVSLYQKLLEDSKFAAKDEGEQVGALIEAAKLAVENATPVNALNKLAVAGTSPMTVVKGSNDPTVPATTTGDPVQDTALNGSQVTSLVEIITNIGLGRISKETGQALIRATFPSMDERLIAQMMSGVVDIDPTKPSQPVVTTSDTPPARTV